MTYTITEISPRGVFEIIDENKELVYIGTKKQCEVKLIELTTQKQQSATMPQIAQQ